MATTSSGTAQQKSQESQPARAGSSSGLARRDAPSILSRRQAPFSPLVRQMSRINEEMDRLFDSLGFGSLMRSPLEAGLLSPPTTDLWAPDVEMFQRDNQLVIRADLPGLKREDLNVEIDEAQVIIRGERRQEQEGTRGGIYRSERSYGMFERVLPLPEGVDSENARANYHDGVLEITMSAPRAQHAQGRRLEIQEGPPPPSGQTTH